MHTHFVPSGFYAAASKGRDWYGCTLVRGEVNDGSGGQANEYMVIAGGMYPLFPGEAEIIDPVERSRRRKAEEDIDIQAMMLGTDHPALDGILNGTVKWIRGQSSLSATEKAQILGDNAACLLGLSPASEAPNS